MKRLLLLLAGVLALTLQSQAQFEQGNAVVGINSNIVGAGTGITLFSPNTAGFSVTTAKTKFGDEKSDGVSRTSFNLSPIAGLFVMDQLLVGVGLGFDYAKWEDEDDPEVIFGISPFARYYFDLDNVKPFAQVGFGVGSYSDGPDDDDKESIFHYGVGAGIALFLNDKVSIDIALGYTNENYSPKDNDDVNYLYGSFGLGAGLTIFL